MPSIFTSRQAAVLVVGMLGLVAGLIAFTAGLAVAGAAGVTLFGAAALTLLAHSHRRIGSTMWTVERLERAVARLEARPASSSPGPTTLDLERTLANQATVLRVRWDARFDDLEGRMTAQLQRLEAAADPAHLDDRLDALHRKVDRAHARTIAEVDALEQLRRRCPLDAGSVPLLSRWALAPSAMLEAVDTVLATRPQLVVELGAGASTIYLARALQVVGHGRLVSLEHLDDYATDLEDRLKVLGLSDIAEIRRAPLVDDGFGAGDGRWYDASAWDDLDGIDLLLVDGPPGGSAANARGSALPALADRLRSGATVILDDAERPEEQAVIERWLERFPLQRRTSLSSGHAVFVVREA